MRNGKNQTKSFDEEDSEVSVQMGFNPIKPKPKKYVLVQNAGQDDEFIVEEFRTIEEAYAFQHEFNDDVFEIMKRLPDGTLTTDF